MLRLAVSRKTVARNIAVIVRKTIVPKLKPRVLRFPFATRALPSRGVSTGPQFRPGHRENTSRTDQNASNSNSSSNNWTLAFTLWLTYVLVNELRQSPEGLKLQRQLLRKLNLMPDEKELTDTRSPSFATSNIVMMASCTAVMFVVFGAVLRTKPFRNLDFKVHD